MSDGGPISPRRALRTTAEAVETERMACTLYLRGKAEEVKAIARRGGADAESSDLLAHRLMACADSIDARLHLADAGR